MISARTIHFLLIILRMTNLNMDCLLLLYNDGFALVQALEHPGLIAV